jgi:hypothetical protein
MGVELPALSMFGIRGGSMNSMILIPALLISLGYYQDFDRDGYTFRQGDCNDRNASIHPNAGEICDDLDNDCNGLVDDSYNIKYYVDQDYDGYGDFTDYVIIPSCGTYVGYTLNNSDCNDYDPNINPAQYDYWDGVDNDCKIETNIPSVDIYNTGVITVENGDNRVILEDGKQVSTVNENGESAYATMIFQVWQPDMSGNWLIAVSTTYLATTGGIIQDYADDTWLVNQLTYEISNSVGECFVWGSDINVFSECTVI